MGIASDLILVILAALLGGFLTHLIRQPIIFGYLFAGILIGPHTGGFTVRNGHDIEMLAELGVALLLFTIGLEFPLREVKRLARVTLFATPLQMILCMVVGYVFSDLLGISGTDAMWFSAAITVSSTMVVLKTLSGIDSRETTAGRAMTGMLIAQDLGIVPLLLILPQLSGEQVNILPLLFALAKAILFLASVYLVGTKYLPRFFAYIAQEGSRELFLLTTLGIALGMGILSHELGFSFALGAFVAGMLLSDSEFHHQAISDVSSLRDVFALIFFVSVGMLFDPVFFWENFPTIAMLSISLVLVKALVIGIIFRGIGYSWDIACLAGFGLSQVGEFALVIASSGRRISALSAEPYSLLISITVVTMVATPFLFSVADKLAKKIQMKLGGRDLPLSDGDIPEKGHVVIIGSGVVGRYVARTLEALETPSIVIEYDANVVRALRAQGTEVLFGDATKPHILQAAGVGKAKLVVITTTNDKILPHMLAEIRSIQSTVPIVVRVQDVEDVQTFAKLGVREVVQPQLEAGLEIVRQALLALGSNESQTFSILGRLRALKYNLSQDPEEFDANLLRAAALLQFYWMKIEPESSLAGKSLAELKFREQFGVSVVAILKGEEFLANPSPNIQLEQGHYIGILGSQSQLEACRQNIDRTSFFQ